MLDRFLDVRKSLKKVVTKQEFTDCVQKLPLAAKSASDDPIGPCQKAEQVVETIEDNQLAKRMEKLV
jgi:hypothetical protein